MSMLGSSLLNYVIHDKKIYLPNQILDMLHIGVENTLKQKENTNRDGMDVSICMVDRKENKLHFAGANNPIYILSEKPLYFTTEDSINHTKIEQADDWILTEIKGNRKAIGGRFSKESKFHYSLHSFDFDQEMRIYMSSDGFADQFGGKDYKKIMSKGFKQIIINEHKKPYLIQKENFDTFFNEWLGDRYKQIDDVLVLGLRIKK